MPDFIFVKGSTGDADELISLVDRRIRWMDRVGIDQWNNSHYHERYPREYYQERARRGELFLLRRCSDGVAVAGGVLFESDPRWGDRPEPAYYIHHLAADEAVKGAGEEFVRRAADYARRAGKTYLRLDSKIGNAALERWYTRLGFEPAGACTDLYYEGILRQLRIQ